MVMFMIIERQPVAFPRIQRSTQPINITRTDLAIPRIQRSSQQLAIARQDVRNKNPITAMVPLSGSLVGYRRAPGNSSQSQSFSLTSSGALRWRPAPGALMNLLPNESFDASSPLPWSPGMQLARVTSPRTHGAWSLQGTVTQPSGHHFQHNTRAAITPGTWTFSMDIFNANSAARMVKLWLHSVSSPVFSLPPGQWTRVAWTFTVPADVTPMRQASGTRDDSANPWQVGDVFYFDATTLSPSSSAAFFDGSVAGATWIDLITGQLGTMGQHEAVERVMALVEEGTTNEILDPLDNNQGLHWEPGAGTSTNYGGGGAIFEPQILRTTGFPVLTMPAGGWYGLKASVAPAVSAGQTRTAQAIVLATGNATLALDLVGLDASNAVTETLSQTFAVSANTQTTLVLTATFANASTVKYVPRLRNAGSGYAMVYFGYLGCEAKPYATTWCTGNMGTGYSWAGTAHASASSRLDTNVLVPNGSSLPYGDPAPPFSVAFWLVKLITPPTSKLLFAANHSSNWPNGPGLISRSDGTMAFAAKADGSYSIITPNPVPVGELHHYCGTWDGTTWRFYFDGVLVGSNTSYAPKIIDGYNVFGGSLVPGFAVGGLLYADRAFTDQEVAAIYNEGHANNLFGFNRSHPHILERQAA